MSLARTPTLGDIQELKQNNNAYQSVAFTHGGSDLDITESLIPCATDFFCTATGNLTAQLAGDSTVNTYPVTAGTVYRGLWVLAKGTSTADGVFRK